LQYFSQLDKPSTLKEHFFFYAPEVDFHNLLDIDLRGAYLLPRKRPIYRLGPFLALAG